MEENANRQRNALNGAATRIAGIYLAVAVVWIYASDRILASLVRDRDLLTVAQTWKGWFFVVTTAVLLFALVRRDLNVMHLANSTTRALANQLQHYLAVSPTITYAMRFEHDEMFPDWVSDNILELLGYTATEALAPDWWQAHIHPDDRARVSAAQPALLRENVLYHEYRFLRKDGTELWVFDKACLLRDANGLPDKVVGAWTDITERKHAEQALAESEIKYRLIADGTDDWVYWIDTDNRFRYISPACERVTGYAFEDFVANPNLLREIAHPDDRECIRQHLETCHTGSGGAHLEFRILHKDGEERWIGHSCAPIYSPEGAGGVRTATSPNANEPRTRSAGSTWNSKIAYNSAPPNSKPSIENWKPSPIRSPMICARHCGPSTVLPIFFSKSTRPASVPKGRGSAASSAPTRAAWDNSSTTCWPSPASAGQNSDRSRST